MPGKFAALRFADERTARAELVGSANTLVRTEHGWRADNTDVDGWPGAGKPVWNAAGAGARLGRHRAGRDRGTGRSRSHRYRGGRAQPAGSGPADRPGARLGVRTSFCDLTRTEDLGELAGRADVLVSTIPPAAAAATRRRWPPFRCWWTRSTTRGRRRWQRRCRHAEARSSAVCRCCCTRRSVRWSNSQAGRLRATADGGRSGLAFRPWASWARSPLVAVVVWAVCCPLIDIRLRRLPDPLTLGGAAVILLSALLWGRVRPRCWGRGPRRAVPDGASGGSGRTRRGDVKLALGLGALTGAFGLPVWVLAALGAPALTATAGIAALVCRSGARAGVPHGPSMCAASLTAAALAVL